MRSYRRNIEPFHIPYSSSKIDVGRVVEGCGELYEKGQGDKHNLNLRLYSS